MGLLAIAFFSLDAEEVRIRDRRAHQERMEVIRPVLDAQGRQSTVTNTYIRLGNGINYRGTDGNWEETKAEFELVPEGAIAWKGQHRVSLAGDLNTAGAVQLRLPDGRMMESHVLGLAYYDASTGDSVLIATVKDSQGWLVTTNQITYPDAFTGASADVRYTFAADSFEQDIILRERPPSPEKFGFNPEWTRLEVWTEFTQAPVPSENARQKALRNGLRVDEADEELDFGSMRIEEGRSFLMGAETERSYPVRKGWIKSDGRTFLVEALDLPAVTADLEALPASTEEVAIPAKARSRLQALREQPVKERRKSSQTAMHRMEGRKDMVASYQKPGFVLDYQLTISSDRTDFTFESDSTYLIDNSCDFLGTTTLEGGCVIKFPKYVSGTGSRVYIKGAFVCKTSMNRPAIFTSKDDDSVGDTISGSTGSPGTDRYGYFPIRFYNGPAARLEHVRFRHCVTGPSFQNTDPNVVYTVAHAQLSSCQTPFYSTSATTVNVHNVLVEGVLSGGGGVFAGAGSSSVFNGQHVTIHNAYGLLGNSTVDLKNSLIALVTSMGGYANGNSQGNQTLTSDTGVFQSVQGGNHYLPAGSPHRNPSSSVSIDATLAEDLKRMTTEAPTVLSGSIGSDVTRLSPRVQRDLDMPDRGYHYPQLDYIMDTTVLGSTLTLDGGVVVAAVGSVGMKLEGGAQLLSEGRAERLNVLTRYSSVQERAVAGDTGGALLKIENNYTPRPLVSLRFTEIGSCGHNVAFSLLDSANYKFESLTLESCQLRNARLVLAPSDTSSVSVTLKNNLFERCYVQVDKSSTYANTPLTASFRNNLFWHGNLQLAYSSGSSNPTWTFRDNLLDRVTNSLTGINTYLTRGYNAFVNGTTTNQFNGSAGDQTLLLGDYQAGPLGSYYLPISGISGSLAFLRNAGSQSAAAAGLYHYASSIGMKEGEDSNGNVDIGFHYVAADSYHAQLGYGSTQGANGWWYLYADLQGQPVAPGNTSTHLSYNSTSPVKWHNPAWGSGHTDEFLRIEAQGGTPGGGHDFVRRFGVPRTGKVWIAGAIVDDPSGTGGDGIRARIGRWATDNSTFSELKTWTTVLYNETVSMTLQTTVTAGETLDFQVNKNVNGSYDYTKWSPAIVYETMRDTDGDGIPDYVEDRNGNGASTPDSGETDWDTSANGTTDAPGLNVFTAFE